MRIVLNGIPPSLNEFLGRNEWNYRSEKSKWTKIAWLKARASKERPAQPYEKADVIVTYYFADKRRHDADNYCGKLFMDGLTKAGVIKDDDFAHITTRFVGKVDKTYPRTEIEIIERKSDET